MFVFQDCAEASTLALDMVSSASFLRGRNGIRVLGTFLLLHRVSWDLERSFGNQHTRKKLHPSRNASYIYAL